MRHVASLAASDVLSCQWPTLWILCMCTFRAPLYFPLDVASQSSQSVTVMYAVTFKCCMDVFSEENDDDEKAKCMFCLPPMFISRHVCRSKIKKTEKCSLNYDTLLWGSLSI